MKFAGVRHQGRRERARRFAARETAQAFKSQTEAAQSHGVVFDPAGGKITFRRYAEQWLDGRSLSETTRDNYADTLARHVYPTFGGTPIGKLTPDEIRRWHRPLRERIASTASRAYRIMHAILATAVDDELIPRNPCRIRGASSDPHNERPFVPAEVVLAVADIAHRRIRAMILVAGFGGLRYGELRGLRVRHYDRLQGTVMVREVIDKRSRRKEPKTDSSQRTVALPRFVLDAIDDHLRRSSAATPTDPLFPGEAGGIISDGWFQREWRIAKRTVGLPDEVHFHDLRHTAGTVATQQGATMKEVMARLGHCDHVRCDPLPEGRLGSRPAHRRSSRRPGRRAADVGTTADGNDTRIRPSDPRRPRVFRGFSRSPSASSGHPETEESPAIAGDSLEHPQRDSNPCRHLERVVS